MNKEEITGLMEPIVESPNFYTRYYAVKSLAKLASSTSADTLARKASDTQEDMDLRVEAIEGLGVTGAPGHVPLLTALLSEPFGDIRTGVVRALGKIGCRSATAPLIKALGDEGDDLEFDDEFEWDPQWDVQLEAIKALGLIGAPEGATAIISFYEKEESHDTGQLIFDALCSIGSPDAVKYMKEKLKDGEPVERRRITEALAKHPIEEFKTELGMALLDKDPETRVGAARALAEHGDKSIKTQLALMFQDKSAWVRAQVVSLLMDKGLADGLEEHFLALLKDPSPEVRVVAVAVLGKSSLGEASQELVDLARNDSSDEVVIQAVRALLGAGSDEVPQILAELTGAREKSAYLRIRLVQLVDEFLPSRVGELLGPHIETEPRQVGVAIAGAIAVHGGEECVKKLLQLLAPTTPPAEPEEGAPADVQSAGENTDEPAEHEKKSGEKKEDEEINMARGKKAIKFPGETPGALTPEDIAVALGGAGCCRDEVTQALIKCLESGNKELASSSALSLGRLKSQSAWDALGNALGDTSALLRARAALALGAAGAVCMIAKLGDRLVADYDDIVREKAAQALGMLKDADGLDYLLKGLDDQSLETRGACVVALGEIVSDTALDALLNSIFDYEKFADIRGSIYKSLARYNHNTIKDRLMAVLEDKGREAEHWMAVEAFGSIYC